MSATINSSKVVTKNVYAAKISPREVNGGISIGDSAGNIHLQGTTTINDLVLTTPLDITINPITLTTDSRYTFNPALSFSATYFQYADEITLTINNFGGLITNGTISNSIIVINLPHAIFAGTDPSSHDQFYAVHVEENGVLLATQMQIAYQSGFHPTPDSYSLIVLPNSAFTGGRTINSSYLTVKFRLLF